MAFENGHLQEVNRMLEPANVEVHLAEHEQHAVIRPLHQLLSVVLIIQKIIVVHNRSSSRIRMLI